MKNKQGHVANYISSRAGIIHLLPLILVGVLIAAGGIFWFSQTSEEPLVAKPSPSPHAESEESFDSEDSNTKTGFKLNPLSKTTQSPSSTAKSASTPSPSKTSSPTTQPSSNTATSAPTQAPTATPAPTASPTPTEAPPTSTSYSSGQITVNSECTSQANSTINVVIIDNGVTPAYQDIWTYLVANGNTLYLAVVTEGNVNASASIYGSASSIRGNSNTTTIQPNTTYTAGFAGGEYTTFQVPSLGSPVAEVSFTTPYCSL